MSRKIIFIIVGALLFLALLALLWFWLLHRSPAADTGAQSGFGTSTDRNVGSASGGSGGNTPGSVSGQGNDYAVTQTPNGYIISSAAGLGELPAGTYQIRKGDVVIGTYALDSSGSGTYTIPSGNIPSGTYTFTPVGLGNGGIGETINVGGGIDTGTEGSTTADTGGTGTSTSTTGTATTTGAAGALTTGAWLGANISERIFSPSDIEALTSTGAIGGTPLISTTPQPANISTSGLVIAGVVAACLAQWLANQATGALASYADPTALLDKATSVPVQDSTAAKQRVSQNVIQCLVKSIAQAAIDQITRSVVNWINSGFNGQPSFVTNFNQYFASVADQAAGEFIKSSALSFLCSPFAPQIKIAIAQSYANRNNAANTCSLSKVTNNINGFLTGNWGTGGWGGLLQLTTIPTNNPYGAYAYAQIGLNSSVAKAQGEANRNISPGGFLSVTKCDNTTSVNVGLGQVPTQKNCKVQTPGQVIQDSLNTSLNSSVNQLQVAQNIDDIIRALVNQLMLKTLYGGLANANSGITNPLAPAVDQAASAQAQALLASLQQSGTYAVQYGNVKQGSASDIQQVQNNFNTLFNCWETAASSTALSADVQAQAAANAAAADAQIASLQARVDAYNADIERANTSLAAIQNLQTQVMFATTPEDIQAATYAIQAATPTLVGQADVTTAQQDRTSLQAQLTATNGQAQAGLAQCHALGV